MTFWTRLAPSRLYREQCGIGPSQQPYTNWGAQTSCKRRSWEICTFPVMTIMSNENSISNFWSISMLAYLGLRNPYADYIEFCFCSTHIDVWCMFVLKIVIWSIILPVTFILLIGHVDIQSCLPINLKHKPISLQYYWLSDEQPIRIGWVLYLCIIGNFQWVRR